MAETSHPNYPPKLGGAQEDYLVSTIKDWSIAHGLAVRPASSFTEDGGDKQGALATTAPVTVFPSFFPQACFSEALNIQQLYNELYAKVASDESLLEKMVNELVDIDDYISKLWDVHLAVKKEGYAQDISLGLFRSDYMVHQDPAGQPAPTVRQVEFNTIASSFGGLASRVTLLHQFLRDTQSYPDEANSIISKYSLPENKSVQMLAKGMAASHALYGNSRSSLPLCILFIVQDPERNTFDQKHVEYELQQQHSIEVFRLPFNRVLQDTSVDEHHRALVYALPAFPHRRYEATVVYLRAGYSPSEYASSQAWQARLHLERSAAIKCPSVLTHLAGSKKIQQLLALPNSPQLAQYVGNPAEAQRLRGTFAPMYPLDESKEGEHARKLATDPETAQRYVMKPQREGGGNNIYRKAIPGHLASIPKKQWPAYILMEMIETPPQRNYILRNGELQSGGVICELGVYGACLWRSKEDGSTEMLYNEGGDGYLLRTKGDTSEEGGVAAGFGAVDSCCIV